MVVDHPIQCQFNEIEFWQCNVYALVLASLFVLNLYVLLPKSVSILSRSHERQIKWRILSVMVTCMIVALIHPRLFCFSVGSIDSNFSLNHHLIAPLRHLLILYSGSIISSLLHSHVTHQYLTDNKRSYIDIMYEITVNKITSPFTNGNSRYQIARDLVVAPLAEEIIFRQYMITPMIHSKEYVNGSVSLRTVCLTAPLFFGLAHIHHAYTKICKDGVPVSKAISSTCFQFLYTYLFGAYASYCYIKTKSCTSVYLAHAFCNYMSLPNIRIFTIRSNLKSKLIAALSYVYGIHMFRIGFRSYFENDNQLSE